MTNKDQQQKPMFCAVGGVVASAGKRGPFGACGHSKVGTGCGLPSGESCEHQRKTKPKSK